MALEALRRRFGAETIAIALPGEIRAIGLQIFDRTFLITYLMEKRWRWSACSYRHHVRCARLPPGQNSMLRHLGFRAAAA